MLTAQASYTGGGGALDMNKCWTVVYHYLLFLMAFA